MSQLLTPEARDAAVREIRDTYRPIPQYYVQDILGAHTWTLQDEITKSVFENKLTAVKTCNAVGKSFIAARIALTWLSLYEGSIVITTAPTWRQVKDVLWREVAVANKLSKVKLTNKEVKQAGLDIDKDWYAVGLSTKYPENFFGYHAAHLLVIVDEAGGVPPIIFKGVKAITPNAGAHILYIGNPTNPEGPFFDVFDNPKILAKRFSISIFDSPNFVAAGIRTTDQLVDTFTAPEGVDELEYTKKVNEELYRRMDPVFRDVLIDPYTSYQDFLEWGADSNAWQSLRLAEFPSQADNALIPVELVSMAMQMKGVDPDSGKTYAELSGWTIPDGPPEFGLDVARFGPDLNVLTPRHGGWVESQQKWNKKGDQQKDLWETAERTLQVMNVNDWNTRLNLDDTGLGGGVSSHIRFLNKKLRDVGQPGHQFTMQPYNMASKEFMQEPDKFYDITSELYWHLRGWFYRKEIAMEYDKNLFNQLVSRRWTIVGGKIKVESKEEYKKRTKGKSPDESDSLALAFAGGVRASKEQKSTFQKTDYQPTRKPYTSGLKRSSPFGPRQW